MFLISDDPHYEAGMLSQYTIVDGVRQKAPYIQRGGRLSDPPWSVRARAVGIALSGVIMIAPFPFIILEAQGVLVHNMEDRGSLDLGVTAVTSLAVMVGAIISSLVIGIVSPRVMRLGPYENGLQADLDLFIHWSQVYELRETEDEVIGRQVWVFTRPPMHSPAGIADMDSRQAIDVTYVFDLYRGECERVTAEMTGVRFGTSRPPRLNVALGR
jgi:hypothetical protein